jgi:hypothetical protein
MHVCRAIERGIDDHCARSPARSRSMIIRQSFAALCC